MPKLRWVRIVGVVGALWNAIGVMSYLGHVGLIAFGAPPPGGAVMPAAVTACFAVSVFGGVVGSIGLAMLARAARPVLWLSWIGTVIDWTWVFGWSGAASVPLGITVLIIATLLLMVVEYAARRVPVRG